MRPKVKVRITLICIILKHLCKVRPSYSYRLGTLDSGGCVGDDGGSSVEDDCGGGGQGSKSVGIRRSNFTKVL